jgi:hypothetical protein
MDKRPVRNHSTGSVKNLRWESKFLSSRQKHTLDWTHFPKKDGNKMKRFFVLLTAVLLAGLCIAACGNLVTPAPTVAPTRANPMTVASPTVRAEPSPTRTESSHPGKAVSFDRLSLVIPTGMARGGSGTLVPEVKGDSVAPWDVAPDHIQFNVDGYAFEDKLYQPQIYVYPAQAYAQLQERGTAAQSLERLNAVLAQSAMVNVKELPSVPFFNVSQALAAQVKVIPFQNGRGVRMVTEYAGGRAIINNRELIYEFQGLTEDGQYYVVVILPVTAPGLPEDGQPGGEIPPGGVPVPDFNDMNANWMGYYGGIRQMLQGLEPIAYNPNLDQLDALIGSLTIATSN